MQFTKVAAATFFFFSSIYAAPLQTRASCIETCGSTCYWQSDIDAALNQGYSLLQSGETDNNYPHQYRDDEGFDFPVSGPYYEYPILSSYKVYTGGSPGADRVIFNSDGDFAGLITHTGSSNYDGFVQCNAA
ncbi:extracellular guanyl-specific ribonuclease RntA [Talaromyces stipitatus ATCC 10500]|uniref:ribonuclease T1 n=1 Tax=Talaromyces stipitatus (strain ATCC 10500 / CBS 375.48 / QM 6759 / NRRL 1006) TaxID=441959 RepID=B8MM43_TALSN|nr:extracellular guanyl-specific ribonuclease RntA [Talaromyces stipitatus ATCC 10500]EED13555.1 extracellular guanyl-specific ribonuclease RntA [Talaromyces stipitatus ATCC 10500]